MDTNLAALWYSSWLKRITWLTSKKRLKGTYIMKKSRSYGLFVLSVIVVLIAAVQPVLAAKNIILCVGDGMGYQAIGALMTHEKAQLLNGNATDEEGRGIFQKLMATSSTGFLKTNPLGYIVTDSAAAATAIACGKKTLPEVLGKDGRGNDLESVLKHAQKKGRKTGLISTHCITDATPGAFYANVISRNMQDKIAEALIETEVDVALGGGLKYFIPQNDEVGNYSKVMGDSIKADSGYGGASGRRDSVNLIEEAKAKGYTVVVDKEQLADADISGDRKLLGLFSSHHMAFEVDRQHFDTWQPSLNTMTKKALNILEKNDDGFFLMVEGASIDSSEHYNDAGTMLGEIRAFAAAVETCVNYAKTHRDTLVIVTADHETGIPAFVYKKLRREAKKQTFVDGKVWKENYDMNVYANSLLLDEQKISFVRLLHRANKSPEKLVELMKKHTGYDYDIERARIAMADMPARDSAIDYADPIYEFGKSGTIWRCGRLSRTISPQTGIVWATGHHGGTPVPMFGLGKGSKAVRGLHDNTWICQYLKSVIR